jgi:serine/threonine protein kinase
MPSPSWVTPVGKSVLPTPNDVWITPKMIVTLCGVLSYAHEKEIIHRDVKPVFFLETRT